MFALGYILFGPLEEKKGSAVVTDRLNAYTNPKRAAILPETFRFKSFNESVLGHQSFQFSQSFRLDESPFMLKKSGYEFLRRVVAKHSRQCRVGNDEPTVRRRLKSAISRILENGTILTYGPSSRTPNPTSFDYI